MLSLVLAATLGQYSLLNMPDAGVTTTQPSYTLAMPDGGMPTVRVDNMPPAPPVVFYPRTNPLLPPCNRVRTKGCRP